ISSSLVKAAAHGRDPNWGRIAGAAGNATLADEAVLIAGGLPVAAARARAGTAADLDPDRLRIAIAGQLVFDGTSDGPGAFDQAALGAGAGGLRGVVNGGLVAGLRDLGGDAVGLSGGDGGLLVSARVPGMGLVAHGVGLRRDLLDAILVAGQVPVVAPLARDEEGVVCNVNADDVAAGIAAGLGARQLVLMTDVDGFRDADGRRLAPLTSG